MAAVPGRRQGGQQDQLVRAALHKRIGDTGDAAEVPVDLEGRMVVEKVRQGGAGEQRPQVFAGFLPIAQRRPEIDDPRPAPAGVAAAVGQARFQRSRRGFGQAGRFPRGNLMAGKKGVQVRDVAVARKQ